MAACRPLDPHISSALSFCPPGSRSSKPTIPSVVQTWSETAASIAERATGGFRQRLRGNRIDRLFCFSGYCFLAAFTGLPRPNMEPAMGEVGDFPCSPNAFALAKAAVKDIVCPHVAFGPIRLFVSGIVAASDEKPADVIN